MFCQLEITTRCNYTCWYCAGRHMPQKDMSWATFSVIIERLPQPHCVVSLQGEGEPSLHPRFWDMVQHVRRQRHLPYTILNGSRVDAQRIAQNFPSIAFSIDTLEPGLAERIGRHNLSKVLKNLEQLMSCMSPQRIVIMTVDFGQPLDALRLWVRQHGFAKHIVQPLMRKQDYARHYPTQYQPIQAMRVIAGSHPRNEHQAMTCRFLSNDSFRYYTWSGQELPCCFIKDPSGIDSIAQMREHMAQAQVPMACQGCQYLTPLNDVHKSADEFTASKISKTTKSIKIN